MTHQLTDPVTFDAALTAMIIWELVLEDTDGTQYPGIHAYREQNGVCETRDRVFELAGPACALWNLMEAKGWPFDAPFDFEFLPLYLKTCTTAAIEGDTPECLIKTEAYVETAFQLHQYAKADQARCLAAQNLRSLTGAIKMGIVGPRAPVEAM
jgi:hypothetical protein